MIASTIAPPAAEKGCDIHRFETSSYSGGPRTALLRKLQRTPCTYRPAPPFLCTTLRITSIVSSSRSAVSAIVAHVITHPSLDIE